MQDDAKVNDGYKEIGGPMAPSCSFFFLFFFFLFFFFLSSSSSSSPPPSYSSCSAYLSVIFLLFVLRLLLFFAPQLPLSASCLSGHSYLSCSLFFCKASRLSTFLLGSSYLIYAVVLFIIVVFLYCCCPYVLVLLSLLSYSLFGLVLLFASFCVFLSAFLGMFRLLLLIHVSSPSHDPSSGSAFCWSSSTYYFFLLVLVSFFLLSSSSCCLGDLSFSAVFV